MQQHPSYPRDLRRRRPSPWWFALGGGLLTAAAAAGIGLLVWTLSSFAVTDATVPVDGAPHRVEVGTADDTMMWFDETVTSPSCRVVDTATGEDVPLEPVTGELRRSNGSAGDWIGARRFDPGSGDVEVTCVDAAHARAVVQVGPAPDVGSLVGAVVATIAVPLLLGLAGLSVLLVTGVLWATGRPRSGPS